jgi:orotate phosphoribosyltransferase
VDQKFENVSRTILTVPGLFKSISENPAIISCREVSPYYIDNRKIQSYPNQRNVVAKEMMDLVYNVIIDSSSDPDAEFDSIVNKLTTTESAGISICTLVGDRLSVGTTYVKKKAKGYGLKRKIEGDIEEGEYVVGVDDLVTKGTNAETAINAVRGKGAKIDKYFVIFDRKQGATEFLDKLNVELYSLSHMSPQFMEIALEMGVIEENEMKVFGEYAKDPTKWSRNFLRENPDFLRQEITKAVENGVIKSKAPLEVLTVGHPELKERFEPEVKEWLTQLKVKEPVPEFGYEPPQE